MKKRKLSLLLTLLTCLMGTNVYAYDIMVNNDDGISIYYNIIKNGTELEVTYLVDPDYLIAAFVEDVVNYRGALNIPETVTYMGVTRKVTAIGDYAFFKCRSLSSVTIPASVSFIGENAFSECRIRSVHISSIEAWFNIQFENYYSNPLSSNAKFYVNGEELGDNLVIPDGITAIRDYAFFANNNIVSVTIPNSVTYIGNYAFAYCTYLASINIPNGVTYFGSYVFAQCYYLTSITIPNGVTSIESHAFYNCSGLTSITIPNGVTSIGSYAFSNCNQLTSITIPNSVTSIGSFAFSNCLYLTSITIPSRVISLEEGAFRGCFRLASIDVAIVKSPVRCSVVCNSQARFSFSICSSPKALNSVSRILLINKDARFPCSMSTALSFLSVS